MSRKPVHALLIAALLVSAPFPEARAGEEGALPSWYKKKKTDKAREEQERREDELRKQELPEIGAPGRPGMPESGATQETELSAPEPDKNTSDNRLFKNDGLTGAAMLGVGKVSQPEFSGTALMGGYGMGWWWKPNLVLTAMGRASVIMDETYFFMLISIGPQLRFFPSKRLAFGIEAAYGYSVGLSRVNAAHLPTPPDSAALAARRGPLFGANAAYLLWPKRDLGVGPVVSFRKGTQGERSVFEVMAGITLQDGRPSYTGDLTKDW